MTETEKLSAIISNYRKGELETVLDKNHVEKWLDQFDKNSQPVILSEMIHILEKWYFDIQSVQSFLRDVLDYLRNQYDINDLFLCNEQLHGSSQRRIIECYRTSGIPYQSILKLKNQTHFIYLDDGIYTGSHIRKDIEHLISKYQISKIDIITMIAYSSGFDYSKNVLTELGKNYNIQINLFCWKPLQNTKTIGIDNNSESYYNIQDTLWPTKPIQYDRNNDDLVKQYTNIFNNSKFYYFRSPSRDYESSVFSSEKARRILEYEFLIKGIEISKQFLSYNKGLYPLGYDITNSLGFGSLCAFDFNISNTCPLVLWWGDTTNIGVKSYYWYPLLPRRTE